MKLLLRRTNTNDLENIYNLQKECFSSMDSWYKSFITNFLDSGYVVVMHNTNTLLGVLLYGEIVGCGPNETIKLLNQYNVDISKPMRGIMMICVNPSFQSKGLATRLITRYHEDNKNIPLCLNTRLTNKNAINLYKKMGYQEYGVVRDKYFNPTEDCLFMYRLD
jgi:ribosomal protein S18 acetylase RimI-like enzyme